MLRRYCAFRKACEVSLGGISGTGFRTRLRIHRSKKDCGLPPPLPTLLDERSPHRRSRPHCTWRRTVLIDLSPSYIWSVPQPDLVAPLDSMLISVSLQPPFSRPLHRKQERSKLNLSNCSNRAGLSPFRPDSSLNDTLAPTVRRLNGPSLMP